MTGDQSWFPFTTHRENTRGNLKYRSILIPKISQGVCKFCANIKKFDVIEWVPIPRDQNRGMKMYDE